MKRKHLALIISSAVAAGFIFYYLAKKDKKNEARLTRVADEGYETAEDILYPLSHNRRKR